MNLHWVKLAITLKVLKHHETAFQKITFLKSRYILQIAIQKRNKKAGLNESINSVNRIFGEIEPAN